MNQFQIAPPSIDTSNNPSRTNKDEINDSAAPQRKDYVVVHNNIESIQNELDLHISQLCHEWKATIPFDCHVLMEYELLNGTEFSFRSSKIDICDYLGGHKYPASRLVFCPIKYPPPSSNDKMTSKTSDQFIGWSDLRRDLLVSSFSAGNPIISNG